MEALIRLEAGEELRGLKTEFQRKDGCTVWGEFRIYPDMLATETTCRFTVIFQDTTLGNLAGEHARLQEELHRERLEQIVIQRTHELHTRNKELIKQIEERARVERALKAAKEEAETANKAKTTFLASMSHEIRTPINAMLGMSQVLSESTLTDEQTQYVRILRAAGEGLLTIVNNILDISKIETGQLQLENTNFRLEDVLESIFAVQRPKAQAKQLELHYQIEPGLPTLFFGDPLRLNQILSNILNNAIKFTEQGGVRLIIERESKGPFFANRPIMLLFKIVDTGIGIAPTQSGTIFESFTQADTSITRKYGGSGLGLSISKVLVELMGGSIWFTSALGMGSEFCFTVRLTAKQSQETTQELPLWRPLDSLSVNELPALNILLVEDSQFNAFVVTSYLKGARCNIDLADNGEAGLNMFRQTNYDLVLMDIQMPVMDGYTATSRMRRWETEHGLPATPIFAMTAFAMKDDMQKSYESGCNLHLVKPLQKDVLVGAIYGWFSSPHFYGATPAHTPRQQTPSDQPRPQESGRIDILVDPDLFEMAPRFLETVKNNLRILEELAQKRDFGSARTLGHQMKGEGKLFGLNLVSKLGLKIQKAAEAENSADIITTAHELINYLERVRLILANPD